MISIRLPLKIPERQKYDHENRDKADKKNEVAENREKQYLPFTQPVEKLIGF